MSAPKRLLAYDRSVEDPGQNRPSAILYRCKVPGDYLCPCGTVARRLRKSGVPYEEIRVSWSKASRPEVVECSGQARVPVLVWGGEVISDSKRILEHLAWKNAQPGRSGV